MRSINGASILLSFTTIISFGLLALLVLGGHDSSTAAAVPMAVFGAGSAVGLGVSSRSAAS